MEPAQAPALPPKGMTSRAPAMRQPGWVQRDGEFGVCQGLDSGHASGLQGAG